MTHIKDVKPMPTVLAPGGYRFIEQYSVAALQKLSVCILAGSPHPRYTPPTTHPVRQVKFQESQTAWASPVWPLPAGACHFSIIRLPHPIASVATRVCSCLPRLAGRKPIRISTNGTTMNENELAGYTS